VVSFYDNAVEILAANGWKQSNPATFTKDNFEIAFDTSNYIEVIKVDDKKCIFESHLTSDEIITHILTVVIPKYLK